MNAGNDRGLTVLGRTPGVWVARHGDVIILWQFGEFGADAGRLLVALGPKVGREYPGGTRTLIVVEDGAPAPSDEVRAVLAHSMSGGGARATGVSSESQGFRAAQVTGVLAGLQSAAHTRVPMKVFSSVRETTEWLGSFAPGGGNDGAALLSAIEQLRAMRG